MVLPHLHRPTSNTLLINFRLSSDAEIFVNEHRLSRQVGAKTCKNMYATCTCSDGASILHATVAGWVGGEKRRRKISLSPISAASLSLSLQHPFTPPPHTQMPDGGCGMKMHLSSSSSSNTLVQTRRSSDVILSTKELPGHKVPSSSSSSSTSCFPRINQRKILAGRCFFPPLPSSSSSSSIRQKVYFCTSYGEKGKLEKKMAFPLFTFLSQK